MKQDTIEQSRAGHTVDDDDGMGTNAADVPFSEQVRRAPYISLATAVGAGFVLGGGLASRAGLQILGAVTRAFLVPAVVRIATTHLMDDHHVSAMMSERGDDPDHN